MVMSSTLAEVERRVQVCVRGCPWMETWRGRGEIGVMGRERGGEGGEKEGREGGREGGREERREGGREGGEKGGRGRKRQHMTQTHVSEYSDGL